MRPVADPSRACVVTEHTFELWHRLAAFPADQTEQALSHLMEWLARAIDADNVIWVGAVRVLRGAKADTDPFFGWRLRARSPMRPDSESYTQLRARYYATHHYGKRTPTFYNRSHAEKDEHVGITGRASFVGAGRFRVHVLRDGWIDFAAFRRTPHYRLYYRGEGIVDRMTIGFPVNATSESFLLIDRCRRAGVRRQPFGRAEIALAGGAVRGIPELHRRLFLTNGLVFSDKPLSPTERKIVAGLLTGHSEKELSALMGQNRATLHKYVTALFARFGVNSRPALMALWLDGVSPNPPFRGVFRT